jgi:hypothetical protein
MFRHILDAVIRAGRSRAEALRLWLCLDHGLRACSSLSIGGMRTPDHDPGSLVAHANTMNHSRAVIGYRAWSSGP